MSTITGQSDQGAPYFGHCGFIAGNDWLNEEISTNAIEVSLKGEAVPMATSSFVAVASRCSHCHAMECSLGDLWNNNCEQQRGLLDEDVQRWYQAYEATMYNPMIESAFRSVVKRIGTGPWGAGDWLGDSQRSFLAVWLATGLLKDVSLDYYAYSRFCENPANQCLVLDDVACKHCLALAYPLPGTDGKAVQEWACRGPGLGSVVDRFLGTTTAHLLDACHASIQGPPKASVFGAVMR